MEVVHLAICACSLAACALLLTAGVATRHAAGWGMRRVQLRGHHLASAVGSSALVALLLGFSPWNSASDEVSVRLARRGTVVGREEACGVLVLAGALGSVLLCLLARSPLGGFVGILGCLVGVPLWDASRRRTRERALIDEMPEVFRTLAMALGSGETLTQAIEYVGVHERGYAARAFVNAALRLRCGSSTEEAMDALARELEAPGVGLLTTALVIAQRTGSPLRGLFQSSAQLVERQGEYERMLAVKTAQVRLSVRIVCLLPLMLVALLSLISQDFQSGVTTVPGMMSLAVASLMDAGALLLIRSMMRGVL